MTAESTPAGDAADSSGGTPPSSGRKAHVRGSEVNPRRVRLEASSHCQLRCPSCPTTQGKIDAVVGKGVLQADAFDRFLARNPQIVEVELSNWGEILLNPELVAIIRLAAERRVQLTARNGVNFNHARDDVLEAMVVHRFGPITCSIDGASQESYSKYRVGGDFDRVLTNIRRLNELKARHDRPEPELTWQFVVFGYNEHEIEEARSLATALGMRFRAKLSWDEELSPVRDPEAVMRATGIAATSRSGYRERFGLDYKASICHQLWDQPMVNWNGRMLGCCANHWGSFGDRVFDIGLRAAANNDRMRYARAMLQGLVPARDDVPCTQCERYVAMQADGTWLRRTTSQRLAGSWVGSLVDALRVRRRRFRSQQPAGNWSGG